MGMSFTGRRNENDRYRMVAEHENGLCGLFLFFYNFNFVCYLRYMSCSYSN
jgi:hypothetical protein